MKGGSFLLRCLAEIPSRMVQVLHCGMLPPHLRFALKHSQPGRNPGQCFALNMLPDDSVLSQSFKQAGWDVALSLVTNLNPDFNLQNPFFFVVAVGLLVEGRVALLNLPPSDAAILVKLVQSQPIAIHRIFCVGSG